MNNHITHRENYMKQQPVLVTLTSPTAAGKSYLFNYIRDVAKLPCLISTTTRAPRANEVEGVDYYFIDESTSVQMEQRDQFAELAVYRGVRYGVTREEFMGKLSKGIAFLIVEPSGIEHYVAPAVELGALHLKYYIHTDFEVRLERFKKRLEADVDKALGKRTNGNVVEEQYKRDSVQKIISSYTDRLVAMTTEENKWGAAAQWDRTLFGTSAPEDNLKIILSDVEKAQQAAMECHADKVRMGLV